MEGLLINNLHPTYAEMDIDQIADFDFLRLLEKQDPKRIGAKKISRKYLKNGVLFANCNYEYLKDANGQYYKLNKEVCLMTPKQTIGAKYTFPRVTGLVGMETELKKGRASIIDDMKSRARKYNSGEFIDILYEHLSKEKQNFIDTGSLIFADRIKADLVFDHTVLPKKADRDYWTGIKGIYNTSLDGVNKVYETLIFLTTI